MTDNLVNQGYNALMLSPISDSNLTSSVDNAKTKKIPTINVNDGLISAADYFVGPDAYQNGELAAEWVSKQLGDKGEVAIVVGMAKAFAARERTAGFKGWIKDNNSGLKVVAEQNADWDRQKAKELASTWIQQNPDLKAIFCNNDDMALGVVEAVEEALEGKSEVELADIDALPLPETKRLVTTGGHYAYLKIAEGCDKHCTYCIIPKVRGNYRSVPMERLIKEAQELADQGVKELILVAQETTVYGQDIYGEKSLHKLLKELCQIKGIRWIRLLYCYPEEIDDNLIQVMKEESKICHYLDLPIQHASDAILKRMGRRTSKQQLIDTITKLRKEIPDIALRTTLITGFPGETQEQHEEVMEFVDEMEFERLGVFTYSPEEDTPAATMPDQIDEEVKEDRQADIMELQQEIVFDQAEDMIGKEVLVMIEGKVADENAYVGRTYRDAPNVDGLIFVNTDEELMTGDFAKVKVTGAAEYDLIGELI